MPFLFWRRDLTAKDAKDAKGKHKVPPAYSRADDSTRSLDGCRDDDLEGIESNTERQKWLRHLEEAR